MRMSELVRIFLSIPPFRAKNVRQAIGPDTKLQYVYLKQKDSGRVAHTDSLSSARRTGRYETLPKRNIQLAQTERWCLDRRSGERSLSFNTFFPNLLGSCASSQILHSCLEAECSRRTYDASKAELV